MNRGVVGRESVGTAFPYHFHVLLKTELEAVSKWLFFGCVSTPLLSALHPCLCMNVKPYVISPSEFHKSY